MAKNYYDILGVPMDAPTSDIQQAYWRREDDLRAQGLDSSDARFQELRNAYETLSNFLKRREYDEQLKQAASAPTDNQPETLDEVRVELADLLGQASSPVIMDSWQSEPESVTTSAMDDKDIIADVDAELDALFQEAQKAKQAEVYDDDDPFAQIASPNAMPAQKLAPRPPAGGLQARKVNVQKKESQRRSRGVIVIAMFLVCIASCAVFALIPTDESINTGNGSNSSGNSLPTRAPRPTSTPAQGDIISRLEEQGDVLFADGDYTQAVTRYTQAIGRGASAQLYYKRALAFWSSRELMEDREVTNALSDLDTVLEWEENYLKAHQLRGIIYYELWGAFGVEDDAVQALESLNTYIDLIGASTDPTSEVTTAIRELEAR